MTSQEQLNQPELSPEDITPPIPVPVNQPGLPWPRTVQVHAGSLRALVILGCWDAAGWIALMVTMWLQRHIVRDCSNNCIAGVPVPNPPLAKPIPWKETKMEMTYVGGKAGWVFKGEPSRYVGGMAGWVYKGEPSRYVGGMAGWVFKGEPSRYVGGMAGWVSCQAAANAAPEPRYVLAS